MATKKKKTNFVSYEIKKLESYIDRTQKYLDKLDPENFEDRIEESVSTRGNPIIKVIATQESQMKAYMDILKNMPKMYEDLNHLRAAVEGIEEAKELRGNQEMPAFMADAEEDEEDENFKSEGEQLVLDSNNDAYQETDFGDDDPDNDSPF